MRLIPLLLAALMLAACNQVYTRRPLFSEAHEAGDPQFRPGLYSITGYNEDCRFDIRRPLRDWPDCAIGIEFRRGEMFFVTGHDRALAQTQRFVEGDPILVQGKWRTDILKDPRAPEPRDADNPFYGWVYYAVTPGRTDGSGRMMEARLVEARCGPPPAAQPGRPAPKVTDRPFPGLLVVRDNCQARDLDTVKRALQLSAGLGEPRTLKWIRDQP